MSPSGAGHTGQQQIVVPLALVASRAAAGMVLLELVLLGRLTKPAFACSGDTEPLQIGKPLALLISS